MGSVGAFTFPSQSAEILKYVISDTNCYDISLFSCVYFQTFRSNFSAPDYRRGVVAIRPGGILYSSNQTSAVEYSHKKRS